MEKKPEQQVLPKLPRAAETPGSPSEGSSQEGPPGQLSAKARKQLRKQARTFHERDWLAPAGSVREKQLLRGWLKHGGLSREERDLTLERIGKDERDLIREHMSNPDEFAKRNALFWHAAKKSVLGYSYDVAMERHRKLDDSEFLVACLTVRGLKQKEIASLAYMGESMVDKIIGRLKVKIAQDRECDAETVDRIEIGPWFFGL
jgi:hypothetical protein